MPPKHHTYRFGQLAEYCAIFFLVMKGYHILKKRYKNPLGEVDLIAVRGRQLVFVEVKARKDEAALAHTLTPHQQARITRGASHFLAHHPRYQHHNMRFDLIMVGKGLKIRHIQGAWETVF
jgi:putative endonuclease